MSLKLIHFTDGVTEVQKAGSSYPTRGGVALGFLSPSLTPVPLPLLGTQWEEWILKQRAPQVSGSSLVRLVGAEALLQRLPLPQHNCMLAQLTLHGPGVVGLSNLSGSCSACPQPPVSVPQLCSCPPYQRLPLDSQVALLLEEVMGACHLLGTIPTSLVGFPGNLGRLLATLRDSSCLPSPSDLIVSSELPG